MVYSKKDSRKGFGGKMAGKEFSGARPLLAWTACWFFLLSGPAFASGIDMGFLGRIDFTWEFVVAFLSIVAIDIVLAGDNALVIALAVKNLPPKQKNKGIIFGAGAAVILRVIITFCIAQVLQISFVKLGGGALVLWIAVKLFSEGVPEGKFQKEATTYWQAIRIIVIADIVMSTDNVLAVAGACKGNFFLLLFGLALSIPLVVFTSRILSELMDRYPIIIYIGAGILGRVGAEMMITDPWVVSWLAPGKVLQYTVEGIGIVGVLGAGRLYLTWKASRQAKAGADQARKAMEEFKPLG